jgi:uncharacterized iron-regulated membrane protein
MNRSRALMRRIHLWLGLSVGLLFALLGLTGSALVFYVEIDAWLHPATRAVATAPAPDWASPVWDRAYATVRTAWPERHGEWRFEATDALAAIPARYSSAGHHGPRAMVWLSPDGRRVVREDAWGQYLMTWLYELHMDLLAGDTGRQVVGWSGVAMLVLLLTGLFAWWPRGSWRKALAFKRRAVPLRRLRDLHKLAGLGGLVLLLLLTATGVMLALPDEKNWLLARTVSPIDPTPAVRLPPSGTPPLPLATLLAAAHRALPEAKLVWIEIPGAPDAPIRLRVRVPGDPSPRFPRSYLHVDRHSAKVLAIVDYRRGSAATTINTWLHPLHDAAIGGLPTRILVVLVGLLPGFLLLTGLLRWRRRRFQPSKA